MRIGHAITAGAVLVAVFVGLMASALAHSFYPAICCSGNDCAPISAKRVKPAPGGYLVDGVHFVKQAEVRKSEDADYHACFPRPNFLRCFFAPPTGS